MIGFHMVTSRVYKSSQPYYVSLRVCSGLQQTRPFSLCERPAEISTKSNAQILDCSDKLLDETTELIHFGMQSCIQVLSVPVNLPAAANHYET
jgi:hypothetical protein